ncbi:hypothetical protein HG530_009053 [Fusarium avenaceum]|nr:hypothetical protein HG530_009053 [Fusarium avenaceum]
MGKFVAARVLICPLLHGLEHIALNLNLIVACRRMMEGTEDVVNDLVDRDTSVFPCKENTTRGQETEDKSSKGLANLLEKFLQAWDLGDTATDGFDDLVAEFQNGVDLACGFNGIEVRAHTGHLVGVVTSQVTTALFVAPVALLLGLRACLEIPGLRSEPIADTRKFRYQTNEV